MPFTSGRHTIYNADAFQWLREREPESIHGVVTDPPYGVIEFDAHQIAAMKAGKGGIWRIPPSFDGAKRQPLPRFTALNEDERKRVYEFFKLWSELTARVLVPGAHVMLAGNAFLSTLVFSAIVDGGLEFRGQVMRLVQTFRGGDRPKLAEEEFPEVCSLPRGCYEPWGIFRAPMKGLKVAECLRKHGTGGLRRLPNGPFEDVIAVGRTPKAEKAISGHPSQKPMALMTQLVRAILPVGQGIVLDPFMGSGTTIAAAEINGYNSIGVEMSEEYYEAARKTIPQLVAQAPAPLLAGLDLPED